MPPIEQIFMLLFLMLGPFKIIGPFARMTKGADPVLIRKISINAILFSAVTLILAAFLGQSILARYGVPVPILALAGGIIFFVVALQNITQQFYPTLHTDAPTALPSMKLALSPLAFPTIVTPYGIAAVIVLIALSHDTNTRLMVIGFVLTILLLNLLIMLITHRIIRYLLVVLPILSAIIGVIQVAIGLNIIYNAWKSLVGG